MTLDNCSALITGASAGIGREFALQLARRARTIVLVARRGDQLEQLRGDLTLRNPKLNVHVRAVDLAEAAQVDSLLNWLKQDKIDIDFLINNAGLGDYGPVATSQVERDIRMIQVNITALTLLARSFLPVMIARRRGAILNVSSSAGFLPIPGMAIYAATKAFVNSFSEALRIELRGTGVRVTALCPGPVHTEFGDVAKRQGHEPERGPEFVYVPVEQVVKEALAAIEADRPLVVPGLAMKLSTLLIRLMPMPVLRWASRFSARRRSGPAS
jgi:short-subunit dehydrogenase